MIDHTRDDLVELPCDCEPAPSSFYLRLPSRSLAEAVRDVSRVRDLDTWVWDLLRPAEVISLAAERAKRRPLIRKAWTA
jgi:hypothetical protein